METNNEQKDDYNAQYNNTTTLV